LLIRPKKGKDPQERIKDMFNNVVSNFFFRFLISLIIFVHFSQFSLKLFDKVKQQLGVETINDKVKAIAGDVMLEGLGISDEDLDILREEVSIIYHCAATVR